MGLNDSQNTAALSGATVGGALANLAAAISGWFEVTQPAQRDELAHRAILVLIMGNS